MKNQGLILISIGVILILATGGLRFAQAARQHEPATPQGSAAPTIVSYQGRVQVGGVPFTGSGYFKFAIVNYTGNTTYWSNDGSSSGGSEPTNAVQLPVNNGLFTVLLGDTSLEGMTRQLGAEVFSGYDRYLRVWFRAGSSGAFTRLTPDTRIAAVPYALQAQHAASPALVIIVSKSNGDFTSIQAAIDSIPGAPSPVNPILIWIAPGVYNEAIKLKPNVHLQGAGQRVTVIQAPIANGAVLTLSNDTTVRDLSISNTGSGTTNYGMYGENVTIVRVSNVYVEAAGGGTTNIAIGLRGDTQVTLENVTAFAGKTGGDNIGLRVAASPDGGPEVTVHGGTFTGSGGTKAYGIQVDGGLGTFLGAADVRAYGQDASNTNVGLSNSNNATVLLQGGFFRGSGGNSAYGIESSNGARLEAEGVMAQAEGGSIHTRALYNYMSQATLRGGTFTAQAAAGSAYAIHNFESNSILEVHNVTALATGGTYSYGLIGESNTLITRVYGGTFTARGGNTAVGIYQANVGETTIQNALAVGENGTSNYGLSVAAGTVRADGCHFKGSTYGVRQTGGSLYLAVSQLDGGMQRTGGTAQCYGTYGNNYAFYPCP